MGSVGWWLSLCGLVSYKSDTLNKPGDDHEEGKDDEEDDTEDDDCHVHVFLLM